MRSFPDPPKVVIVTMLESPRYVRGLTGVGRAPTCSRPPPPITWSPRCGPPCSTPGARTPWWGCPRGMLEETGEGAEGVLSARELEILLLAARGLSNGRIASLLHISEATVKRHLANVYRRWVSTPGRGRKGGPPEGLDHHRGDNRRGRRGKGPGLLALAGVSSRSASAAARSTTPAGPRSMSPRSSMRPSALRRASMPSE